jgi:hypothetical protein
MSRLEADIELRRAVADEAKRIADEQAAALERQRQLTEDIASSIESVAGNLSSKIGDFASARLEQEAADIATMEANLQRQTDARVAALDREIAAARGNASKTAALQSQKAKLEAETARKIEKAKADHAAKADKIERIQKGGAMLLEGALSTVKAATSYPNVPAMVAHAAAAAFAFTFGAMTLAGGFPGAGGGASMPTASGGAGGGDAMQFTDAAKTPGSTASSSSMPSPGPRLGRTDDRSAGMVVNGNVTFIASGSIDRDAAEAYALETSKAARSREGAGRQ